jgi:hypothetical protein
LIIALHSSGPPTGEKISGITGLRLYQWKRSQRLQLSMSIPPKRIVKTVSNLVVELPRHLLHLTIIQESGMGKRDRKRLMQ